MANLPRVPLESFEPEHLLKLAKWYRSWAEVAGNEQDRANRLELAEHLEKRARERRE